MSAVAYKAKCVHTYQYIPLLGYTYNLQSFLVTLFLDTSGVSTHVVKVFIMMDCNFDSVRCLFIL